MHRHAGGLVQHHGVLALVSDAQRDVLRRHGGGRLGREGEPHGHARGHPVAGAQGPAVGKKAAGAFDLARKACRNAHLCKEIPQSVSVKGLCHREGEVLGRLLRHAPTSPFTM